MSTKQEIIQEIQLEFAKVADIDTDSDMVYEQAQEQLQLHATEPVTFSPTSEDAKKARRLARRYSESYERIAMLFDQLDEEQQRAHFERYPHRG